MGLIGKLIFKLAHAIVTAHQKECAHPSDVVFADILQRDSADTCVQWCYACGAYRVGHMQKTANADYPEKFSEWQTPSANGALWLMRERTAAR